MDVKGCKPQYGGIHYWNGRGCRPAAGRRGESDSPHAGSETRYSSVVPCRDTKQMVPVGGIGERSPPVTAGYSTGAGGLLGLGIVPQRGRKPPLSEPGGPFPEE